MDGRPPAASIRPTAKSYRRGAFHTGPAIGGSPFEYAAWTSRPRGTAGAPVSWYTKHLGFTAALLYETRTRPVVFLLISDPVGDGFVVCMARPAGHATGFTDIPASMAGKWLELLKEMVPRISRVAVMYGTGTAPGDGLYYLRSIQAQAHSKHLKMVGIRVKNPGGIWTVTSRNLSPHHRHARAALARHQQCAGLPGPSSVSGANIIRNLMACFFTSAVPPFRLAQDDPLERWQAPL